MTGMIPLDEMIEAACLLSGDMLQQKYKLHEYNARQVWRDLNFSTLKIATSQNFFINKKTNSISMPCNSLNIRDVFYYDACGVPQLCYINSSVQETIVDCTHTGVCSCGRDLCNMIKGYEAVTEVINAEMPDHSFRDFTCVTRKSIDSNGFYYESKQYPLRVYENSVWTDTVLHTENTQLCKLQVDDKGCVDECEDNYNAVIGCGCYSDCKDKICKTTEVGDTWISFVGSAMDLYSVEAGCCHGRIRGFNNIYTITQGGDRIIFPSNFGWSKVLVRYYADIQLDDMQIPYIAKEVFLTGLKTWEYMFDSKSQPLYYDFSKRYENQKLTLISDLNKYTLAQWGQILAPKTYIPSYIEDRHNSYLYNNNGYN